jgi:hypothetical protein
MPQFDSGAAKQIGRFTEGLLLRLLQVHSSLSRGQRSLREAGIT